MKGVKRNESKDDKTKNWNGFTDKVCKRHYIFILDGIQIAKTGNKRCQARYNIKSKKAHTNTVVPHLTNFIKKANHSFGHNVNKIFAFICVIADCFYDCQCPEIPVLHRICLHKSSCLFCVPPQKL